MIHVHAVAVSSTKSAAESKFEKQIRKANSESGSKNKATDKAVMIKNVNYVAIAGGDTSGI